MLHDKEGAYLTFDMEDRYQKMEATSIVYATDLLLKS